MEYYSWSSKCSMTEFRNSIIKYYNGTIRQECAPMEKKTRHVGMAKIQYTWTVERKLVMSTVLRALYVPYTYKEIHITL